MTRRDPTRADRLAEAIEGFAVAQRALNKIDLRHTPRDLRDLIHECRYLADDGITAGTEALAADVPGVTRKAS